MVLGITGHQKIPEKDSWQWVEDVLHSMFSLGPSLIGLSSLAIGADQLFARLVLQHGGELRVILPFPTYVETFKTETDRDKYLELIEGAASIETLVPLSNPEASYLAAGQKIVDLSDRVIAVWDGKPAVGLGGTGDIVEYALKKSKEVLHVNPLSRTVNLLFPED
jgi:hypothetical protein